MNVGPYFRTRFLLLVGGICIAFWVGEGILRCYRFFFVSPRMSGSLDIGVSSQEPVEAASMSDLPGLFVSDPVVVHRYRRGAHLRWRGVLYEINRQGWRGPDWPSVGEKDDVVLCLGDSITFGYGVSFEETFCKKLEGLLKERFPQRAPIVLNAASDNYNTDQEVRIFKKFLPVWKPDVVVINFYRNDIYPNPSGVDEKGRLYVLHETFSPRSPWDPFFDSFLMRRSLLLKFLQQRTQSFFSFLVLQSPQTASWSQQARCWKETEQTLHELVQVARRAHVQVVFAYFPEISELGILKLDPDFYRFQRVAHDLEVPLVDMRKAFHGHLREPLYLDDGVHPTARGHELAAFALAKVVEPLLHKQ